MPVGGAMIELPHEKPKGVGTDASPDQQTLASEPEGLQLDFKRNLFQGGAALVFAIAGGFIGAMLTDDRPDWAAFAGGLVGAIAGTFLGGFILLLYDYRYSPNPLRIPAVPMSGTQHLNYQRGRVGQLVAYGMLLFMLSILICLIANFLTGMIYLGASTMALTLIVAFHFRPRCPFCQHTLSLTWKGLRLGRFCSHCGTEFSAQLNREAK